jgi:hypothetical protein
MLLAAAKQRLGPVPTTTTTTPLILISGFRLFLDGWERKEEEHKHSQSLSKTEFYC